MDEDISTSSQESNEEAEDEEQPLQYHCWSVASRSDLRQEHTMGKVEGDSRMGCTLEKQSTNHNSLGGFYFSRQTIKRDSCFVMVMMMTITMAFNSSISFRSKSQLKCHSLTAVFPDLSDKPNPNMFSPVSPCCSETVSLLVCLFVAVLASQLYCPCEQMAHLLLLITISCNLSIASGGSIHVCLKEEETGRMKKHFCTPVM